MGLKSIFFLMEISALFLKVLHTQSKNVYNTILYKNTAQSLTAHFPDTPRTTGII